MRLLAAILGAAVLGACGPEAATSQAPAPAAAMPAAKAPTILASDGGVLRPIANGGRVALREGWAAVTLSPLPLGERADLEIRLYDANGGVMAGEVEVACESIDMDHGRTTHKAVAHAGGYRMPLEFAMPGAWRLLVRISRGGTEEIVTLVLPEVGY